MQTTSLNIIEQASNTLSKLSSELCVSIRCLQMREPLKEKKKKPPKSTVTFYLDWGKKKDIVLSSPIIECLHDRQGN